MEKNKINNNDIAIKVDHVSKTFKIPHEKISSVRGAVVNVFKKNSYEEFKALNDVSFEVKKGEFFGIIGRNGSGKSTLLKILAGIYQADKGKVKVHGMISPFLELGIGFNPELSGRDNVYLNATVLGMTKKQIDKKFDDIVRFSELERFIDQKLKNYSSGMQVRLAFSVSIHANRDILLMDEVLAVGDSNFQSKCLEEFNKYRDMGRTVIIVTHDIAIVQRYCDRAMLLRNGKILKIGDPGKVGNEYTYQNMSDEERRIFDEEKTKVENAEKSLKGLTGKELEKEKKRISEEKRKQEEEGKNKIAEIIKVEFLDKDEKARNVFKTGDDIYIRVHYRKHDSKSALSFRFSFENDEGVYLFGCDTITDKVLIDLNSKIITLSLDKNIFLKGKYFVNVSCFVNNGLTQVSFLPRIKMFECMSVSSQLGYKGIISFPHKWC